MFYFRTQGPVYGYLVILLFEYISVFSDDLSSRLSQCEFTESRLHTELEYNQRELQKSKQLSEELREKLEEMGDRLGQYMEHEAEVKVL